MIAKGSACAMMAAARHARRQKQQQSIGRRESPVAGGRSLGSTAGGVQPRTARLGEVDGLSAAAAASGWAEVITPTAP
jgi:hypothetical protein